MRDREILLIENGLLRAFSEVYDLRMAWYPEHEILMTAGCQDASREEVEEARRSLGIELTEINGLAYWRWVSDENADDVWGRMSGRI